MPKRQVVVDYGLCEANAICMGINAEVFDLDDEDDDRSYNFQMAILAMDLEG